MIFDLLIRFEIGIFETENTRVLKHMYVKNTYVQKIRGQSKRAKI